MSLGARPTAEGETMIGPRDVSDRTRLVYVINKLGMGGTQRHLLRLIQGLNESGRWDISVYSLICIGRVIDLLEEMGVEVVGPEKYWSWSPRHVLSSFWSLYRYLREERPAIVHCYLDLGNFLGAAAAKLAGVSQIVTSRRGRDLPKSAWRELLMYRLPISLADRWSKVIISVSEAAKRQSIQEGSPGAKILVIHNGVAQTAPEPAKRRSSRTGPVFGTIGAVTAIKGHRSLVEAAPTVLETLPQARFVVAGEGPERPGLEELARRLGVAEQVDFLGERADVDEVLRGLDVFVLTSLNEGMPNVVLEAMAAGLPVVATRVGGVPEVVEEGVTGLLVEPASATDLAQALVKVGGDDELRLALGRQGRQTAASRFSPEKEIRETEGVYLRLLAGESAL